MRHIGVALICFLLSTQSLWAGTIIQMSRRLRMTTAEGLPPKDFFIDIGSREGIRDGDILTVYRVMPVINGLAGTPYHLMRVPLGELRVMTTGEAVSMGRLHVQRDINEMPAMVSQQFMLGDQVQLKSSLPFH